MTLSSFIDYMAITTNEKLASELILLHWDIQFDSLVIRKFPFRSGTGEIQNHTANWFFHHGMASHGHVERDLQVEPVGSGLGKERPKLFIS